MDFSQTSVLYLRQFDAEDMRIVLDWIYTGDPPQHKVLADKIYKIVLICNFLLIDVLKIQCLGFFEEVIRVGAW